MVGKKWNEFDYVFQNQLGNPYTPERLPRKIQEFANIQVFSPECQIKLNKFDEYMEYEIIS